MHSLVSICIPCHNAGPYIGEALDSVLAQTWPNLEIIVVNDGSTDESAAVLDRYTERGIIVITEVLGSATRARNRAAAAATGDFIKFFDADDLMSPDMIASQVKRLGASTDKMASAQWGRFQGYRPETLKLNPESVWRDMAGTDWLVEAWHHGEPMMQPGIFLLPRALWESVGPWNEELTLIDDFEFFARVLANAEQVLFCPEATLLYRSGIHGSLSGRRSRTAVESAFNALQQGTHSLLARRDDAASRRSAANILQGFIYTYYPEHPDLCREMERQIEKLGGSDLPPSGPPRFKKLAKLTGWRIARRIQRLTDQWRHPAAVA
ncbi:glycosyltransferase family 2 protein [Actomonas aquatica]|uniref:Glycosyltransferase family A protein n=1 Tax=Actomonas aquatica TaxID=2866162 RepID=A0ABZ1CAX4_9BACT|nr:glycosyltransferase family A protein [Opitutus sp. WL0086]WRQ88462.1 glycosyltransferase family A protein [Opitutus sp. WL0086]